MNDFNVFIHNCNLLEAPVIGSKYTWCNGRSKAAKIWAKLDKTFISTSFLSLYPRVSSIVLPHIYSEYSPPLISTQNEFESYGPLIFCFMRMRCTYADFRNIVEQSLKKPMEGWGLFCLIGKLNRLKPILRKWIVEIFGRDD